MKLEAGAEFDFITGDEMGELLTPQEQLLTQIRDLAEADANHEKLVAVESFGIYITGSTGYIGDGTAKTGQHLGSQIFRVPNGYGAEISAISIWTPAIANALASGTATAATAESLGPLTVTTDQAVVGPPVASSGINAPTASVPIIFTFGRTQSPYLRDGQRLFLSGTLAHASSTAGMVRIQYTLSAFGSEQAPA